MSSSEKLKQEISDAVKLKIMVYNLTCPDHPIYIPKDIFKRFSNIELSHLNTNEKIINNLSTYEFIGYATIVIIMNYRCLCRLNEISNSDTLRKVLKAFKRNVKHVRYVTKLIYLQYHNLRQTNFGKNLHTVYFKYYFEYLQQSKTYRKFDFIKPVIEECSQNMLAVNNNHLDKSDNLFIEMVFKDYDLYVNFGQVDYLILMQYIKIDQKYTVIDELLAIFGRLMNYNCESLKEFQNSVIRNDGRTIKNNLGIVQTSTNADLYFYNINLALGIIINNKYFISHDTRMGSDKDIAKLCKAFKISKVLHFVLSDLTADQLIDLLESLNNLDCKPFKNIFVCIMSHGDENGIIYTTDGQITVEKIVNIYKYAELGDDAYKYLLLAACRGKADPRDDDDMVPPEKSNIEIPENMAIFYSTQEGFMSVRDKIDGKPVLSLYTDHYILAEHNHKFESISQNTSIDMESYGLVTESLTKNKNCSINKQPIALTTDVVDRATQLALDISEKHKCGIRPVFPLGITTDAESGGIVTSSYLQSIQTENKFENRLASPQCLNFLQKHAPFKSLKRLENFEHNLKEYSNFENDFKEFLQINLPPDMVKFIEYTLSSLMTDYLASLFQWGVSAHNADQNLYRLDKLYFIKILWNVIQNKFGIKTTDDFNRVCKNWLNETELRILKSAAFKKLHHMPFVGEYDAKEFEEILQQSNETFIYVNEVILTNLTADSFKDQLAHFPINKHFFQIPIDGVPRLDNIMQEAINVISKLPVVEKLYLNELAIFDNFKFNNVKEFLIFNNLLNISKPLETMFGHYLNLRVNFPKEPTYFLQLIWLKLIHRNILHKFSWLPDENGNKQSLKFLKLTKLIKTYFCKHFENSTKSDLFEAICKDYFENISTLKYGNNHFIKDLPLDTLQKVLEYNVVLKNSTKASEKFKNYILIFWNEQETVENNLIHMLNKIFSMKKIYGNVKRSIDKDNFFKILQNLTLFGIIKDNVASFNATEFKSAVNNWFSSLYFRNETIYKCPIEYFLENTPFASEQILKKCDKLFDNSSNAMRLQLYFEKCFMYTAGAEICRGLFDIQLLKDTRLKCFKLNIIRALEMAWKDKLQHSTYIYYWFHDDNINILSLLNDIPFKTHEQVLVFELLLKKSTDFVDYAKDFFVNHVRAKTFITSNELVYNIWSSLMTEELLGTFKSLEHNQQKLSIQNLELYKLLGDVFNSSSFIEATNLWFSNTSLRILYYFLWSMPYIYYYRKEPLLAKVQNIAQFIENYKHLSNKLCPTFILPDKTLSFEHDDVFEENESANKIEELSAFIPQGKQWLNYIKCTLNSTKYNQIPLSFDTNNALYYFDDNRLALQTMLTKDRPLNNRLELNQLECHIESSVNALNHLKLFINEITINFNSILILCHEYEIMIFIKWLKLFNEELIQECNWEMDVKNLQLTKIFRQMHENNEDAFEAISKKLFENSNTRKMVSFFTSLPFKTLQQVQAFDNAINNCSNYARYLEDYLRQLPNLPADKHELINLLGEIFDSIRDKCLWCMDDDLEKQMLYYLNTSAFIKLWTPIFQDVYKTSDYEYRNLLRSRLYTNINRDLITNTECFELNKIITQLPLKNQNLLTQLESCINKSEAALNYWIDHITKNYIYLTDVMKYFDENEIIIYNLLYQLFDVGFFRNLDWNNEHKLRSIKCLTCIKNRHWTEDQFFSILEEYLFKETPKNIAEFVNTVPFQTIEDLRKIENRIKEDKAYREHFLNAIQNIKYFRNTFKMLEKVYDVTTEFFEFIKDKCVWDTEDSKNSELYCLRSLDITSLLYEAFESEIIIGKHNFLYALRRTLFKDTPSICDKFDENYLIIQSFVTEKLPLNSLDIDSCLYDSFCMQYWIKMLKIKLNLNCSNNNNNNTDNDYKLHIYNLWIAVFSKDFMRRTSWRDIKKSKLTESLYGVLQGDRELFNLYSEFCFLFCKEQSVVKSEFMKYLPFSSCEQLETFEKDLQESPSYENDVKQYFYDLFKYYCRTEYGKVEIGYLVFKLFEPILDQSEKFNIKLLNLTKSLQSIYTKVYKKPQCEFWYSFSKILLKNMPNMLECCKEKCKELQDILNHLPLVSKNMLMQLEKCLNDSEYALNYWLFYMSKILPYYENDEKRVFSFWNILLPEYLVVQCDWMHDIKDLTITKTLQFLYKNRALFNRYSKRFFCNSIWRNILNVFQLTPIKSIEQFNEFEEFLNKCKFKQVQKYLRNILKQTDYIGEYKTRQYTILNNVLKFIFREIYRKCVWHVEDRQNSEIIYLPSLTLVNLLQQTFRELYQMPKCEFMYIVRRKLVPNITSEIDKYDEPNDETIEFIMNQLPVENKIKLEAFNSYLGQSEFIHECWMEFIKSKFNLNHIITSNEEYKNFVNQVWSCFLTNDFLRQCDWDSGISDRTIIDWIPDSQYRRFITYSAVLFYFPTNKNIPLPFTSMEQLKQLEQHINDSASDKEKIENYFLAVFELNPSKEKAMLNCLAALFDPVLGECCWDDLENSENIEKYYLSKLSLISIIQTQFEKVYNLPKSEFMFSLHKLLFADGLAELAQIDRFPLNNKIDFEQLENTVNKSEHVAKYLLKHMNTFKMLDSDFETPAKRSDIFVMLTKHLSKSQLHTYFYWFSLLDEVFMGQFSWDNDIKPLTITKIFSRAFGDSQSFLTYSERLFCDHNFRKVYCSLKSLPFKSLQHLECFEVEITEDNSFKNYLKQYFLDMFKYHLYRKEEMLETVCRLFFKIKDICPWDYDEQINTNNMKPCIRTLNLMDILQQSFNTVYEIPKWEFLYAIRIGLLNRAPIVFGFDESSVNIEKMLNQLPLKTKLQLNQFEIYIKNSEYALNQWLRYTLNLSSLNNHSTLDNNISSIWYNLFDKNLLKECTWDTDVRNLAITRTLAYRYKHIENFQKVSKIVFCANT